MNNYTVLVDGKEPIASYDNEFKGKRYFHIRKMWQDDNGEFQPGKGLAVSFEQRELLIKAISQLGKKQLKVVGG